MFESTTKPDGFMEEEFMRQAVELAVANVQAGRGGPFAALVVKDGQVIARGTNRVTTANDPTAHAEIVAIRNACAYLERFQLDGCDLYSTCEPCPMCMGAIYWARPRRVFYAGTRQNAAHAGFDDEHIYDELTKPPEARILPMIRLLPDEAHRPFDAWKAVEDRVEY